MKQASARAESVARQLGGGDDELAPHVNKSNNLAEGSQWDLDALKVGLEGLRDLDFDTGLTRLRRRRDRRPARRRHTEALPPAQTGEESKSDSPTLRLGDLPLKRTEDEARDFRAAVAEYGDREGTTSGFVG